VDKSDHLTLVNAGDEEVVSQEAREGGLDRDPPIGTKKTRQAGEQSSREVEKKQCQHMIGPMKKVLQQVTDTVGTFIESLQSLQ